MIPLRRSKVLNKLRNGEYVYTFKINLDSSRAVEIAAMCGFDCVWACDEHISSDPALWERQILAAKAYDIDLMMRVQRGSYSDLIKPLELDASGLMVPHVMSAVDAAEIVRHTRFAPLGRRPVDGGNSDGQFCLFPALEYYHFANNNRFILIQIEDVEALAELNTICRTPGIDIIFFGPADFSQSIGVNGDLEHPEVRKAMRLVAETARKYGKFAGTTTGLDGLADKLELGFQFICIGADVIGLGNYCKELMTGIKKQSIRFQS